MATFSRTESVSNSSMRWNVRPRPRRARVCGGSAVTSSPNRRTVPSAGRTTPLIALNVVVFPAPFGPMSPVMRPAGAARVWPATAVSPP